MTARADDMVPRAARLGAERRGPGADGAVARRFAQRSGETLTILLDDDTYFIVSLGAELNARSRGRCFLFDLSIRASMGPGRVKRGIDIFR